MWKDETKLNKNQSLKYINLPIFCKEKIQKEEERKSNKFLTAGFIIFIIMLLMFCGYSMAKSIEDYVINAKAQIAEPILIVENNPAIDITETKNYGEYIFKIKNYNDQGKLSECDLKYYIEILTKLDNSINIELYQGENKIELHNNKNRILWKLKKNQKEDREYKIKVTYDNENTEVGNDILEKIQIKVHTEQEKA